MKKLVIYILLAVFSLSFAAGALAQNTEPPECFPLPGPITCIWRCDIDKHVLYNCCRYNCEGGPGTGKMVCWVIGTC